MAIEGFDFDNAEKLIEFRDVYDGWSVMVMKDGRMLNRWPPGDRRHQRVQDWIERQTPDHGGAEGE